MTELRRRLLEQYEGVELTPVERELLGAVSSGPEMDTQSRSDRLQALRAYDPGATLAEELTLALRGHGAEGALTFDATEALLPPLQDTLSAVVEGELELEIFGISPGSTVLHLRPVQRAREDIAGVPVDATIADAAMRGMLQLLAAVEGEADLREFTKAVTPAAKVLDALDRYGLDADVTWWAANGDVREVSVTRRGRDYLRQMTEPSPEFETAAVAGRVVELRESGVARVKTGTSRKSPAHDVHFEAEELLGMHLQLGDQVHFVVRRVKQTDRLGRELSLRLEYLRRATAADPLGFDEG